MKSVSSVYKTLLKSYGPQGWWPLSGLGRPVKKKDEDFDSYLKSNPNGTAAEFKSNWPRHLGIIPREDRQKFEIILGAILTQNTNWNNVEKALYNINSHNFLHIKKIKNANHEKLARFVRPAGYYNQKAERLKMIAAKLDLFTHINAFFLQENIRHKLLEMNGIGPETADSMLLYAGNLPFFVIDAYTKRLFSRLGFCKEAVSYHELQGLITKNLKQDLNLFKEFHALIVEHAKQHCRTKPICEGCPLGKICRRNKK